ncbi:MAG: CPBP family intramembrane metalloprotease, partial [Anaerolineae bacterium]|jgi:hypothetical protein
MRSIFGINQSIPDATGRVSRGQFLRLGWWFTLALWLMAAMLSLLFGRLGIWSALKPAGLASKHTALGGLLGLLVGAGAGALVVYWRPLRVIAERLNAVIAWETFRTSDYVVVASMAALGEEPLFRGTLQPLIGLLPTAVLFGLLHATSTAHVILASVLGVLLGLLYQWSGSLWPPIAAHLGIDLVTGLFLARKSLT